MADSHYKDLQYKNVVNSDIRDNLHINFEYNPKDWHLTNSTNNPVSRNTTTHYQF